LKYSNSFQTGISDKESSKIIKVFSDRESPDRKKVKKFKVFSDRKADYPI